MTASLKGLLHGNTITLEATVPPLEGQRVHVLIEPIEETTLSAQEQAELWRQWAERGPQGPISIEDAELP
ncbi:MAG TPA: hypothetical protein VGP73_18785 [Thermoanaerobaculia bacterium]